MSAGAEAMLSLPGPYPVPGYGSSEGTHGRVSCVIFAYDALDFSASSALRTLIRTCSAHPLRLTRIGLFQNKMGLCYASALACMLIQPRLRPNWPTIRYDIDRVFEAGAPAITPLGSGSTQERAYWRCCRAASAWGLHRAARSHSSTPASSEIALMICTARTTKIRSFGKTSTRNVRRGCCSLNGWSAHGSLNGFVLKKWVARAVAAAAFFGSSSIHG